MDSGARRNDRSPSEASPPSLTLGESDRTTRFEYDAFISYRRKDAADLARWLRNRIRTFKLPPELIELLSKDKQDLYQRKPRIWLDTAYEKASDDFLLNKVFPALDQSERLIVISSPAANETIVDKEGNPADNWLIREVDHFLGGADANNVHRRVDLVLGPGASEGDYPGRLAEKARWDWADFRSFSGWRSRLLSEALDDGLTKLVAALYDVPEKYLPNLRREERGRRRRLLTATLAASLAVGLLTTGLAVWGLSERASAIRERNVAETRLHDAQVQESRLAAQKAQQQTDPEEAIETALRGLPTRDGGRPFEDLTWKALVEAESNRPALRVIRGLKQAPSTIVWDPRSQRIAAADGEQLAVWDSSSGRRLFAVSVAAFEVSWSQDGSLLADGSGAIRSAENGRIVAKLPKPFTKVLWAPKNGRLLAVGGGQVKIFRSPDGGEEQNISIDGVVREAIWSKDGGRILVLTSDGRAHVCDSSTGAEMVSWMLGNSEYKSIDWSADGRLVAAAFDKKVLIWEAANGNRRAEIDAEYTQRIQFSPAMAWLMIAGLNGITLNDLGNGSRLRSMNIGGNASISPDGRLIGVAVSGGVVEWEPQRDRRKWLRMNTLGYKAVTWSPNSQQLATAADYSLMIKNKDQRVSPEIDILSAATGWEIAASNPAAGLDRKDSSRQVFVSLSSDSNTLGVYDVETGSLLQALAQAGRKITGWVWRPTNESLAVIFDDGSITLDDINDQSTVTLSSIGQNFKRMSWGAKWIVVRYADDKERIFQIKTGSEIATYTAEHDMSLPTAFWSSRHILVQPGDGHVFVLDPDKGSTISTLRIERSDLGIKSVYWSPDGRQFVTVSPAGVGRLWDIETGHQILSWSFPDTNLGVSWSPDGARVVTFSKNRDAELREARTGTAIARRQQCWSVTWSPDSRRLLMGCGNGSYWDARTGALLFEFENNSSSSAGGWEAAWDPNGRLGLATVASDNFYIFDRESGAPIRHIYIPEPWIIRGVWDPAGQRVAVFSGDRIVSAFGYARVFDAMSGKEIAVLQGHEKNILGAAWDATGTKLLTWSQDTTARLWDVVSSREVAKLSGHGDFVLSGAWSNDGKLLTTRYAAPPPYVWDSRPFALARFERLDWLRASLAISSSDSADVGAASSDALDESSVCEKGTDDPIDPLRRYQGVLIDEINPYPNRIVAACEKALSADPQNGRLNALYGRAMLHERETKKAFQALQVAVAKEYPMARVYLGEMRLNASDHEHFAPDLAISILEEAASSIPYANVVLARHFQDVDAQKSEIYLNKALKAGEPHAYEFLADREERLAMSGPDADTHWIAAFRNWSIAFNLSRFKLKRGSADWELPLARRAALAWLLAERTRIPEVVGAYRDALKIATGK